MSPSRYPVGTAPLQRAAHSPLAVHEPASPHDFRALFDAHAPALRRHARRIVRSPEVAEDVVQEVFLRLWVARERVEAGAGIRSYLYIATRARALDHLRRVRVEQRRWRDGGGEAVHVEAVPEDDGEGHLRDDEIAAAVERVLATLPPRQRAAAALRLRRELPTVEVARALGISPRTVEGHVARATRVLRARLPALLAGEADVIDRTGARGFDDAPMTGE